MQSAEGYSGGFDGGQDSQKHSTVVTALINPFLIVKELRVSIYVTYSIQMSLEMIQF